MRRRRDRDRDRVRMRVARNCVRAACVRERAIETVCVCACRVCETESVGGWVESIPAIAAAGHVVIFPGPLGVLYSTIHELLFFEPRCLVVCNALWQR